MCLIAFAWDADPRYRLVVVANRDEFHARAAAAADWWPESGQRILAGRDLKAGGSWMGISTEGRFAAVTNRRSAHEIKPGAPSRGQLVSRFLASDSPAPAFAGALVTEAPRYSGFNLLMADRDQLWYLHNGSNRSDAPQRIEAGIYALSNATLQSDWPKMQRLRQGLTRILATPELGTEALFTLLADRQPAADDELPDTGVGLPLERLLSSPFIVSPTYGTRCSTLLLVEHSGRGRLLERRFDARGDSVATVERAFQWPAR